MGHLSQYKSPSAASTVDPCKQHCGEYADYKTVQHPAGFEVAPPRSGQENPVLVDAQLQQVIYSLAPIKKWPSLLMAWWVWSSWIKYGQEPEIPLAIYISKGTEKNPEILEKLIQSFGIQVRM